MTKTIIARIEPDVSTQTAPAERMNARTLKTLVLRFVLLLGAIMTALALAWSR